MKVRRLDYNWHQTSDGNESGEDYDCAEVGSRGVTEIIENKPIGLGDPSGWNYLIKMDDGSYLRVFNPNSVFYFRNDPPV